MGMGYSANYAWVASEKWLESLQLDGWAELQGFIEKYADYAIHQAYQWDEVDALVYSTIPTTTDAELEAECKADLAAIKAVMERLDKDFYYKTQLHLDLSYHDSEVEGGRYDGVDGLFYIVYGVECITLPGQKQYKAGNISKAYWVTYG